MHLVGILQYLYLAALKLNIEIIRRWSLREYGITIDARHEVGEELRITSSNVSLPELGSSLVGVKIVLVKPFDALKSVNFFQLIKP